MNPGLQTHSKLPGLLKQVPNRQMLGSSTHSLTSVKKREKRDGKDRESEKEKERGREIS